MGGLWFCRGIDHLWWFMVIYGGLWFIYSGFMGVSFMGGLWLRREATNIMGGSWFYHAGFGVHFWMIYGSAGVLTIYVGFSYLW